MHVSVIIPTFNRKANIVNSLKSLALQEYEQSDFEVIIVDDGSSDGTIEAIDNVSPRPLNLTVLSQCNRGPAVARNAGARVARGNYILFMDDDCVPDKFWIREIVKPYSDPLVGGVGGRIKYSPPNDHWANRAASVADSGPGQPVNQEGNLEYFVTANASVRKSVFDGLGGFDEEFRYAAQEDIELAMRIVNQGFRLAYCNEAIVDHYHDFSFFGIIKRGFQIGKSERLLGLKHGGNRQGIYALLLAFFGFFLIFPAVLRNLAVGIKFPVAIAAPVLHRSSALAVALGRLAR